MTQQPPHNNPGNVPPQSPGGGYPQPGPGGAQRGPSSKSVEAKGFFAGLFDFSFQKFVTLKFAKFIYIIVMVVIGLWELFGWLMGSFGLMKQGTRGGLCAVMLGRV